MTDVVVLGAGPAGLGAALGLARKGCRVIVVEQNTDVGGNAGSFELAGLRVDYGSHRFHPAADPAVFALVRELLGDDLLERPRHGRIRLQGHWIHFPLKPVDLALHGSPGFTVGVVGDLVRKMLSGSRGAPRSDARDTFASVLERGLGRTICQEFYFPYARKIWGLAPEDISPTQAYKRVSAGSMTKLLKKVLSRGPRTGTPGSKGIFYYPRRGFGQISDRLREASEAAGVQVRLGATVSSIALDAEPRVTIKSGDRTEDLRARHVWSTIPVTTLARLVTPAPPASVLEAASRLELRSMVLVYLVLETEQFTPFDAHYFPEEAFPFTRLSEPKNYAASQEPRGVTVLCAEIPCARGDALWTLGEAELGDVVAKGLAEAGLPITCPVRNVTVRRLPAAYPVYRRGYEEPFRLLEGWVEGLERVLSFGRQGLYAHDNTHHALFMARAAVDCLRDGQVDREAWRQYRLQFESHVVED